ncbi:MAG TPA: DUF2076 domain-containing protein [Methylocystis sp.]|nr:DUF2076 domain-containing protein [Methylocystis sp.]
MSPEERQLLAGLFDRVKANASAPRDADAEAFINEQVKAVPVAPYLLAQTVIVQDFALQEANKKLQELQARVQAAESKPATSFLGGLFGGGAAASAPPPPPRPAPPPGYGQPPGGPWGGGAPQAGYGQPQQGFGGGFAPQAGAAPGGGFLKGALGAAAGVAGGVLLADGIRSLFHGGGMGGAFGIDPGFGHAGLGGGETIVNNYYGDAPGSDAGYDAAYDDGPGPQDADYQDDSGDYDDGGFDSGGDGGFDA